MHYLVQFNLERNIRWPFCRQGQTLMPRNPMAKFELKPNLNLQFQKPGNQVLLSSNRYKESCQLDTKTQVCIRWLRHHAFYCRFYSER